MSRVKIIAAALFAACAFSGAAAGAASANWFVNGSELLTTASVASTAAVDSPFVFKMAAAKITITCSAADLDTVGGTILKQSGDIDFGEAKYLNCNVTEAPVGCALAEPNETISTNPLSGAVRLASKSPGDLVTFAPQTKNTFGNVRFSEENLCAFDSEEPIQGAVTFNMPTGQSEETLQAIEGLGTVENNSLEIAKVKTFIEGGHTLLKLASGSKWSFR